MTNSRMTRRALLTSVMALILCFAMLTGTTFAWFTDQETSGNNKIVAGNLDVELLMYNGTDYVDIGANSDPIFGEGSIAQNNNLETLWEPGKTQVAFLAIRNAGNLALKYNVEVNVTDNGLVDVLEYAIVDGVKASDVVLSEYNWATIKTLAGEKNCGQLVEGTMMAAENGCLDEVRNGFDPDNLETNYFALAIHMKEEADNNYMSKGAKIDIVVNATQVEAEKDSFDENYDKDAEFADFSIGSLTIKGDETVDTTLTTTDNKYTATIPAGAPAGDYVLKISDKTVETDENGKSVVSLDIDLTRDGAKIVADGTSYAVTFYIGRGLNITGVTHNGVALDTADYTYADGNITINTQSFSPFTVAYDMNTATNASDLENGLNKGNAFITEDLTFSAADTTSNSGYGATGISVKDGAVLDGNGKTLTVTGANGGWDCAVNPQNGTVKNLTVAGAFRGIFMSGADGDVYIDNVIIKDVIYTFNSDAGSKDYGVYISNTTLNGWTSFSDCHKEVVFTNCNFGEGNGYAFCRPYNASVFENCVFEEGFEFDTAKTSDITFINCYYGETLITAENAATLATGEVVFFYNGLNGITIK